MDLVGIRLQALLVGHVPVWFITRVRRGEDLCLIDTHYDRWAQLYNDYTCTHICVVKKMDRSTWNAIKELSRKGSPWDP